MKKSKACFISYTIIVFMLLFSCMPVLLFSQGNARTRSEKGHPFIINYKAKEYKATRTNWTVLENDDGMMYFGNFNGILEYDGVKWRKINPGGNKTVRCLAKDKTGRIYYGTTSDFGYLKPDSLGQNQAHSLLQWVPAAFRNFLDIWTIHVTDKGIYFQSRERIFRLTQKGDSNNEKWELKTWDPQTRYLYSFYMDGEYYVHQQNMGFYELKADSLVLIPGSEFLGSERMQVMLPYETGSKNEKQYLLGQFSRGFFIYNGKNFRPFASESDSLIKTGILYKGILLNDGNYALTFTSSGVAIMNKQGKLLQVLNRDAGLQNESVYGINTDHKGNLWLALDNGISKVETTSPFTIFSRESGLSTTVLTVTRYQGVLYAGTTNGLLRFNDKDSKFELVKDIPPRQVFNLFIHDDVMYVVNEGLYCIKGHKSYLIRASKGGDFQMTDVYIPEKNPNILMAGINGGLALFYRNPADRSSGASSLPPDWQYLGHVPGIEGSVGSFAELEDGRIWMGTQNKGVYQFPSIPVSTGRPSLDKIHFQFYGTDKGLSEGENSCYLAGGKEYVINNSYVYNYDKNKDRFFPDSSFKTMNFGLELGGGIMFTDYLGRTWLNFGKETGLISSQNGKGFKIETFPFLPVADRTVSRIFPEQNGIVWFATSEGLLRYDENLKKNYDERFATLLRKVTAGGEPLSIGMPGMDKRIPKLGFKQNMLRFEYTAPFLEQENKTAYQTWLEGFEDSWSDFDNNAYKEYTNLPPGSYHFHVRAKNIYQKLSEEAVYGFTVLPPWYRTWWAYFLYALATLAIIYSLIRWRTRQLQEKHSALEKTVAERTAQLNYRVEELAVINSVQESLVVKMDMQGIYELVGEKMREIFNAQVIDIVTYEPKLNLIEDRYSFEKGDRTLLGPREPKGFRKHIIETGQLLVINHDYEKLSLQYGNKILIGEQPKSAVVVPMISGDRVKGMISLQNLDHENAFSDSNINLLTTLANSMTVALESARLFDETTRLLKETENRTAELAVINSVQEGLARELDIQSIYDLVGNRIRELFNAQVVIIATFDHEKKLEYFNYHIEKGEITHPDPRHFDMVRQHLIQTGQNILINENVGKAVAEFGMRVVPGTEMPKSILFMPMKVGDKVTSYVSLQNID
ncbi:MAG: GAF domain-containing protein [Ferruginibacter sp.]